MNRRAGLIGLFAAETVSRIGSRMSMVALPWFVLVLTGSPAKAGVMAFAEMLPYVLGCALGGPLLDRVGVRRASIAADAVSAVAVAGIPLLYRSGHLGFGALLAAVAVAGLLRALGDTSKQAIFGQIVPDSGMDLTRATGLQDGLSRLSGMLGAPLAGLLIAALDAPTVLLIDAATFAFGALVVLLAVPARRSTSAPVAAQASVDGPASVDESAAAGGSAGAPAESYLESLRTGWRFIRRERIVLAISIMVVLTNLFDQAYSAVLAPVWARDVVGSAAALGLLFGLTGLGAVLGNLVFVAIAPRVPRWSVFAFGFLIGGSPRMFATAFATEPWLVYLVTFAGGIALAGLNPILGAVLYERVPAALRTRVLGMSQAMSWAGIPLGGLLGGALVTAIGLRVSLVVFAAAYLLTTLLPFVDRTWRQLDDRPAAGGLGSAEGDRPAEGNRLAEGEPAHVR
ncbi:MFS transporter [Plantactinospora siamensis]|uniref:MFS transporter n=1 Tax=Plantactinospora siamensis TaxID=555372 RepID=A0ABV6NPX3_9ACTN